MEIGGRPCVMLLQLLLLPASWVPCCAVYVVLLFWLTEPPKLSTCASCRSAMPCCAVTVAWLALWVISCRPLAFMCTWPGNQAEILWKDKSMHFPARCLQATGGRMARTRGCATGGCGGRSL